MEIRRVIFDENTFGITQRSLKVLRDTIAERVHHRIAVFELPTSDLCCGYMFLDFDTGEAIFTGDGFRMDRGGEGGAGYRSAQALFALFRINRYYWETVNIDEIYQGDKEVVRKKLLEVAEEMADTLDESICSRPIDKMPYYER